MSKKHNTKVPNFSSHKAQAQLPKGANATGPAAHPAPPTVPKVHAPKTSGHRGA